MVERHRGPFDRPEDMHSLHRLLYCRAVERQKVAFDRPTWNIGGHAENRFRAVERQLAPFDRPEGVKNFIVCLSLWFQDL